MLRDRRVAALQPLKSNPPCPPCPKRLHSSVGAKRRANGAADIEKDPALGASSLSICDSPRFFEGTHGKGIGQGGGAGSSKELGPLRRPGIGQAGDSASTDPSTTWTVREKMVPVFAQITPIALPSFRIYSVQSPICPRPHSVHAAAFSGLYDKPHTDQTDPDTCAAILSCDCRP